MQVPDFYPEMITSLPEADISWPGLRGWILGSPDGQAVFMECEQPVVVGEHSHGAQFGVVFDGELRITIGGVLHVCRRGDTYRIPRGALHSAELSAGFRALDVFEEPDRYKPKK